MQMLQRPVTTRQFTLNRRILLACSLASLSLAPTPAYCADKLSGLEKQLESARKIQEEERFVPAERSLRKVATAADKALSETSPPGAAPAQTGNEAATANNEANSQQSDPFTRASKLAEESYIRLGDCCQKLQKFTEAELAYKRALEIEKSANAPSQAQAKLTELDDIYRTVNVEQLGDKANDVVKEAGVKNVFAVRNGESENINIELGARFKKLIDNTGTKPAAANDADASKKGDTQVKQIRIDPKLSFQLSKQPNGIKLSNIEGLSVDVGLWVKLMEVELLSTDQGPKARVTAGKFGVQKTVDVGVPDQVYSQVRSGIEKIDPFFGMVRSFVGGGNQAAPTAEASPAPPAPTAEASPPPSPPAAP